MGFDVKAVVDEIINFTTQNYILLFAGVVLLILFSGRGIFARIRNGIERALTDNWQLTLLAATGIALSLASGYTTYDGLRNFTQAPLLSVAISFGIQGVMLIVAWLIGESFATGMNQRSADGRRLRLVDATVGMLLGVAFVGIVFYWVLNQYSAVSLTKQAGLQADWVKFADVSVYFLLAMVLVAMIAFGSRRGGEITTPYAQSLRLIVKNSVLWVMFLASMAASVFFSFDSHFNAIFPAEQRKRAAEIRTTSQIGGVVSDIGALTQKRQIEEADALFGTEGWKVYDRQLANLAQVSQSAQSEIEKFFVQQMEDRRRAINAQQERITSSQSGQAGLALKKTTLTDELSRLKAERPSLAAEYAQHKSEYDAKNKDIDAKRVDALAEDRGVEGTLKQGRGPVYRQRMAEMATLQDQQKIKGERTKDAQKRLAAVETRIAQIERELSTVDGDLAKFKGEAETAQQRIATTLAANSEEEGTKLDPARVLPAFERARAAFRQQPDTDRLAALQQQCGNLLGAMSSTQATKEKVRAIDCDPKQAAEAAARVFALNAGVVAFRNNCAGGDKLARHETTDALLGFGRKCLQDSGLISKDSGEIGARLANIDMNRDDKAHRFVVTWNAFLDGNRLAYLALILAIGVDSLVFMSGLFGANALRSPLSDVPSHKARSAEQLEAIIKNSLGAERLENAELVLAAMKPSTREPGYQAEIDLTEYDQETARRIRKVLVAGASIGAVKRDTLDTSLERYVIRSELFEYLSVISHAAMESDSEYVDRARLIQIVGVSLEPNQRENAKIALQYMDPINQRHGFIACVELSSVPDDNKLLMRNLLNAGMTVNAVQRHDRAVGNKRAWGLLGRESSVETNYLIRTDLFRTLLLYSAGSSSLGAGRSSTKRLLDAPRQALAGQRVNGEAARQLAHHPQSGAAAMNGQVEAELHREIWAELLNAIGLGLSAASRVQHAAVREQATAAWDALDRLAQSNARLRTFLRDVEESKKEAFAHKYSELRGRMDGDVDPAVLDDAAADFESVLKALMLMPEVGVLRELVERLEDAAQRDDGHSAGEHELLELLRAVQAEIQRVDKSRPESWKQITQMIQSRGSELQSHALQGLDPLNKQAI